MLKITTIVPDGTLKQVQGDANPRSLYNNRMSDFDTQSYQPKLRLPIEPLLVLSVLHQAGFIAHIVGGAVRDLLLESIISNDSGMSRPLVNPSSTNQPSPKLSVINQTDTTQPTLSLPNHFIDFDIATNARPEQILELLKESYYENQFGTVSLTYEHLYQQLKIDQSYQDAKQLLLKQKKLDKPSKFIDLQKAAKIHDSLPVPTQSLTTSTQHRFPPLEITTYRTEEKYETGARRPSSLNWGETLEDDLSRRDFTINALALQVSPTIHDQLKTVIEHKQATLNGVELSPADYHVIDLHQGWQDLTAKVVRTVGDPNLRFAEDALRMLRAIRLSVQLRFSIDQATLDAINQHHHLLSHVSPERIRVELNKMLVSSEPKRAIELLDQTDLLGEFLPELLTMRGVEQSGHHTTDVWTHSLDAVQACPSPDPVVRLATLLHDISKPQTFRRQNGSITFYNHEIIGARVARDIGHRLKYSTRDCNRLFTLVRYHMFHYQPHDTDAAVRRFMRKVGLNNIDDILDLREADRLGSGARQTSWRLEEFKQRMIEQLNQPFDLNDLAIDGEDIMRELNLPPGPQIGQILRELQDKVLAGEVENDKESLVSKLADFFSHPLPHQQ